MTLLTLEQVAAELDATPGWLARWLRKNRDCYMAVGKEKKFDTSDLEKIRARLALNPPPHDPRRIGVIYFVTCDRPMFPIKIGFATNLSNRMTVLQVAMPWPIKLLVSLEGKLSDEEMLHRKFQHLRLEGEWFRRDQYLLNVIRHIRSFKAGVLT